MKRGLSGRFYAAVLLAALFCATVLSCGAGKTYIIAGEGKSSYAIVLSAAPSPSERHAAEELQRFVKLATGAELPVVAEGDSRAQQPPRIFVGFSAAAEKLLTSGKSAVSDSLGDEGFIIRTVAAGGGSPDIVIAGGKLRGAMYGVYTFLDRLGFRWYTNRVTRFPEGKVLKGIALDERVVPTFMYREPFIKEAFDGDWAARNRVNSGNAALDSTRGGNVTVLGVHTFDQLIPTSLFKQHPEYFPLIGGKRVTGYVQRCLTNPDVVKIAAENLIAWMDSDPAHHIFTLSQNDVEKYCECPECKKIMDAEGAPSGLYIDFVNKVAEIVEKKHPENYVCTLAYIFTEKPPKTMRPRKNVLVRLCPIFMCAGHPFTECTSPETKQFSETLAGWSKLTNQIFIWHYATDFSNYLMPFPNYRNFTTSIKTYAKSGVTGIFMQGSYTSPGGSDADMRAWVMARLLWNPVDDPDALVNEWMHAIYGPAYAPMRAIFDLGEKRMKSPDIHLRIFNAPTSDIWPDAAVASMDSLYAIAEKLAAPDSTALYYVRKNRLAIQYVKLLRDSGKLEVADGKYKPSGNKQTMSDYDRFMDGIKQFGITGLREEPFDCNCITLLKQRFEDHPVVSVENADMRLDVVPDLGGRIVGLTLKSSGENILGRTDAMNYFYPAYGGYEESTTRTWFSTGFANAYTAEVKGRALILTGKCNNGLVFKRTITLPVKGTSITIGSSITNETKAPVIARLVCHMEVSADPAGATVMTAGKGGVMQQVKTESFYLDGEKRPAGAWKVTSVKGGWSLENRFPDSVESCRLSCDGAAKTIIMETSGFEQELAPGKGLKMENVWEVGNDSHKTKSQSPKPKA